MNFYIMFVICFLVGAVLSALMSLILFSKFKNSLKQEFVHIASNAVKTEQEDLRKQNREALEEKLKPFSKDLAEFKEKVEKLNLSGVENTARLIEQLSILDKNNKTIEQEAKNLTEALTKNQNIKGAYGEEILDTILQNSGMVEGVHFIKQFSSASESLKDDTLHRIRPDVVINLPDNRHLIIDSKVTLTSYLECVKDSSKIKDFKSEVKKRINDLASKNYQNAENFNQPDFIIMYLPIDSSVSLLYEDSEIINLAYKSNIIIAGTSSLLATIRLVNQLFKEKQQAENIQQIIKAGSNLYDTFALLCEELVSIQKNFNEVSSQFTTAINRFNRANSNNPSLFSQVEELKKFGVNSAKEIPSSLLYNKSNEEVCIND